MVELGKVRKINRWTEDEDKIFIDIVNDLVLNKSLTLNKALEQVAEKLKRSKSGCEFRYSKVIREQLDPQVLEKISLNNPASLYGKDPASEIKVVHQSIELDNREIDDFSRVNALKNELKDIEKKVKELETRKSEIVSELQVYMNDIANLIKST